jgi:hypothetical protein
MPAKSKAQQKAAAAALAAKKQGKLPKHPVSRDMAKSMSVEDLEDFASTEHKGLPYKVKKSKKEAVEMPKLKQIFDEQWEKALNVQEEKLNLDNSDEDEEKKQIATKKSKKDRVTDNNKSKSKKKQAKWTSTVAGLAHNSSHQLSTNTAGAARVSHEARSFATAWDEDEYYDDPSAERESEYLAHRREEIVEDMAAHILWHYEKHGSPITEWEPVDVLLDLERELGVSAEDEDDLEMAREAIDLATERADALKEESACVEEACGCPDSEEKTEEVKESHDPNSLDLLFEQNDREYYMADEYYDLTHSPEPEEWDDNPMAADYSASAAEDIDPKAVKEIEDDLIHTVLKAMSDTGRAFTEEDVREYVESELDDMREYSYDLYDLLTDYHENEYNAIEHMSQRISSEHSPDSDLGEATSYRWKKMAGVTNKTTLKELNSAQAKRYVKKVAKHGWPWDRVKRNLESYGISAYDIDYDLKAIYNDVAGEYGGGSEHK